MSTEESSQQKLPWILRPFLRTELTVVDKRRRMDWIKAVPVKLTDGKRSVAYAFVYADNVAAGSIWALMWGFNYNSQYFTKPDRLSNSPSIWRLLSNDKWIARGMGRFARTLLRSSVVSYRIGSRVMMGAIIYDLVQRNLSEKYNRTNDRNDFLSHSIASFAVISLFPFRPLVRHFEFMRQAFNRAMVTTLAVNFVRDWHLLKNSVSDGIAYFHGGKEKWMKNQMKICANWHRLRNGDEKSLVLNL